MCAMPESMMTPPAKAAKRTARSPVNEMDGGDGGLEDESEVCEDAVQLLAQTIADIVRHEV